MPEKETLLNVPLLIEGKQIVFEQIEKSIKINIKAVEQSEIGRTMIFISLFGKDFFTGEYFDGVLEEKHEKIEKLIADWNTRLVKGEAKIILKRKDDSIKFTLASVS